MDGEHYFQTAFATDTATLVVYDPACLTHRFSDTGDWWSVPAEEMLDVRAGNCLIVALGSDGRYQCKIYRDGTRVQPPPSSISARVKTEMGSFYVGAGEYLPGDGMGPDTMYGGVLVSMPAGVYEVTVYAEDYSTLVLRFAPTDGEPTNDLAKPLELEW